MGDIRIRDVQEDVVTQLKAQARRHGRTLGDELRTILAEQVQRPRREMAAELRDFQASLRDKYGELPDSTPGIRQERDSRG